MAPLDAGCGLFVHPGGGEAGANHMNDEWLEVSGRSARPVSWAEMGGALLSPNTMVTSYVYLAHDKVPELFPPPSTIDPPPVLLAKQCAGQGGAGTPPPRSPCPPPGALDEEASISKSKR